MTTQELDYTFNWEESKESLGYCYRLFSCGCEKTKEETQLPNLITHTATVTEKLL